MAKFMYVAPLRGVTMPAAMLGDAKDRFVGVDEAVRVPDHYGQHLIDDGFAVAAEKPARATLPKVDPDKTGDAVVDPAKTGAGDGQPAGGPAA